MTLRIATVQAEAAPGAIGSNLARVVEFITQAAAQGAADRRASLGNHLHHGALASR